MWQPFWMFKGARRASCRFYILDTLATIISNKISYRPYCDVQLNMGPLPPDYTPYLSMKLVSWSDCQLVRWIRLASRCMCIVRKGQPCQMVRHLTIWPTDCGSGLLFCVAFAGSAFEECVKQLINQSF